MLFDLESYYSQTDIKRFALTNCVDVLNTTCTVGGVLLQTQTVLLYTMGRTAHIRIQLLIHGNINRGENGNS